MKGLNAAISFNINLLNNFSIRHTMINTEHLTMNLYLHGVYSPYNPLSSLSMNNY